MYLTLLVLIILLINVRDWGNILEWLRLSESLSQILYRKWNTRSLSKSFCWLHGKTILAFFHFYLLSLWCIMPSKTKCTLLLLIQSKIWFSNIFLQIFCEIFQDYFFKLSQRSLYNFHKDHLNEHNLRYVFQCLCWSTSKYLETVYNKS